MKYISQLLLKCLPLTADGKKNFKSMFNLSVGYFLTASQHLLYQIFCSKQMKLDRDF